MTWPSRSQPTASKMLAHRLRTAIRAGEYAVGSRLPSQRVLAEEFGVAPNTAREAIRILTEEGLVIPEHGRGVYVHAPFALGELASPAILTSQEPGPDESRFMGDFAADPVYNLAGQVFLHLRSTLHDAEWVDAWRVSSTRFVVEWNRGPTVTNALALLLPRGEEPNTGIYTNGIPGLRVLRQSEDDAEVTWLNVPESHALLRRLSL